MVVDHEGKTPVYLQIAAILRAAIEHGDYPPGRQIPSETRLMQEHGVARLTARKAVRVLADAGLVEVVRGRGAYVTER
jgi:DNA-binding GntR family transcriptional regulator